MQKQKAKNLTRTGSRENECCLTLRAHWYNYANTGFSAFIFVIMFSTLLCWGALWSGIGDNAKIQVCNVPGELYTLFFLLHAWLYFSINSRLNDFKNVRHNGNAERVYCLVWLNISISLVKIELQVLCFSWACGQKHCTSSEICIYNLQSVEIMQNYKRGLCIVKK